MVPGGETGGGGGMCWTHTHASAVPTQPPVQDQKQRRKLIQNEGVTQSNRRGSEVLATELDLPGPRGDLVEVRDGSLLPTHEAYASVLRDHDEERIVQLLA